MISFLNEYTFFSSFYFLKIITPLLYSIASKNNWLNHGKICPNSSPILEKKLDNLASMGKIPVGNRMSMIDLELILSMGRNHLLSFLYFISISVIGVNGQMARMLILFVHQVILGENSPVSLGHPRTI